MKTVVGRIIGGVVAMAMATLSWGTGLSLDGVLMVKGLPLAGARLIILAPDQAPRVLTTGLDHFSLQLDLNTRYLLSFEREGCVSKQLQFNTSVPIGYPVSEGFYFPFQVTLEAMPEGQHFAYAGPVGAIHFDKDINAFGYDTDYRIAKDEALTARLDLARAELERTSSTDLVSRSMPGTSTVVRVAAAEPRSSFEVIAPTVSRTAPLVHVLETPEVRSGPVPAADRTPHVVGDEPQPVKQVPELLALARVPAMPAVAATPIQRWKDVQSDRLHVITTIRVEEEGNEVEYRRVVSYYGGITYFRNGLPCTALIYQQGIDR